MEETGHDYRMVFQIHRHFKKQEKFPEHLTVRKILKAERTWIKHFQRVLEEIRNIISEKVLYGQSKIACLWPELKDGIMRLSGRKNVTEHMKANTRQPSPKHEFTNLLIQHYHETFAKPTITTFNGLTT